MGKMTKEERRARSKAREMEVAKADSTRGKSNSYLQLPSHVERFNPAELGKNANIKTLIFDILYYERTVGCDISNPIITLSKNREDNIGRGRPYMRHSVGEGKSKRNVACPRTIGLKCPICDEVDSLYKNYDENKEEIKLLKAKHRTLYNVLFEDKVYVFDVANFHFEQKLRDELTGGNEDILDIEYFEDGKSLKVRFKQSDVSDKYYQADRIDTVDRDDIDESIMDKVANLNEVIQFKSYDELKSLLFDCEIEEEEDDVEEFGTTEEKEEEVERKKPSEKVQKEEPVEEEVEKEEEESEDDGWGDDDDWD